MAPELLQPGECFDSQVDCWSLGVILHQLLVAKMPFIADSMQELAEKIVDDEVDFESEAWETISIEALDLTENLLVKDPN